MASSYKTPGVYIEEIPKLPPSVAEEETAIPAFVGYTERAGIPGAPLPTKIINTKTVSDAKRIVSLLEYETYFGTCPDEDISVILDETITDGVLIHRQISSTVVTENLHTMYYHIQMYFANGGGPCYIVSVGNTLNNSVSKDELKAGLDSVRGYDEPTLLVCPQLNFLADSSAAGEI